MAVSAAVRSRPSARSAVRGPVRTVPGLVVVPDTADLVAPRSVPVPSAALPRRTPSALLAAAHAGIVEAAASPLPSDRYVRAHLAALRAASAVLAARARPASARRGRSPSVWSLLTAVAPDLGEWAAFFAAGAGKRAAAESGIAHAVSARDADDLLRDVQTFLELVEGRLVAIPGALTDRPAGSVLPFTREG
jgi:hypothetical protein